METEGRTEMLAVCNRAMMEKVMEQWLRAGQIMTTEQSVRGIFWFHTLEFLRGKDIDMETHERRPKSEEELGLKGLWDYSHRWDIS